MPRRLAHFAALDTLGHIGTAVRSLLYLVMYAAFAQPRAALWQMYLVAVCLVYCTTGAAYFLSQVKGAEGVEKSLATGCSIRSLYRSMAQDMEKQPYMNHTYCIVFSN